MKIRINIFSNTFQIAVYEINKTNKGFANIAKIQQILIL